MVRPALTSTRVLLLTTACALACFGTPAAGQARPGGYTPGRTADGQPDIQGMWVNFDSTPFEAPGAAPAGTPAANPNINPPAHWTDHDSPMPAARRSMVVDPPDGRVPLLPSAEATRDYDLAHVNDHYVHETPWVRCITRGHPAGMFPAGYNNAYEIVQIPGYVVFNFEMIHETRIVPIDGRKHLSPAIRQWNGDSVGRWEGNTLVIDTINYNGKGDVATSAATARVRAVGQSDAAHVVERFTRVDARTINYSVTVEDPKMFARPWTVAMPLTLDPEYKMYEYACHEGNLSIPNELTAGRAADAAAAKGAR